MVLHNPKFESIRVRMNFSSDLYKIVLVRIGSFNFIIGRSRCRRLFCSFLFDFRRAPQVNFLLRVIPRLLTFEKIFIGNFQKQRGGGSDRFNVNNENTDLSRFIFINRLDAQLSITFKCICRMFPQGRYPYKV